MSSSSPQKLTFSSFKKDKASASNPSPPSDVHIKTAGPLSRFALKFFIVFNIGFSVYLFSLKPVKRKKSPVVAVTVDSNATGFSPESPDEQPPSSTHSPAAPS